MTKDGMTRLRIKKLETLESLRLKSARKIILNLSSKNIEENIEQIDEIMLRNRLYVPEINQLIQSCDDPDSIIKGCSIDLIVDNKLMKIRDDRFRFAPTDDLIEGIRDIVGTNGIKVIYS